MVGISYKFLIWITIEENVISMIKFMRWIVYVWLKFCSINALEHWKIWPSYRLYEMSVDREFTDLILILLERQNVCKLILQTFCLVFSFVYFKMSVKCLYIAAAWLRGYDSKFTKITKSPKNVCKFTIYKDFACLAWSCKISVNWHTRGTIKSL